MTDITKHIGEMMAKINEQKEAFIVWELVRNNLNPEDVVLNQVLGEDKMSWKMWLDRRFRSKETEIAYLEHRLKILRGEF